jgi:hypothetical protein
LKLVYVGGQARSGSTLMGRVLGEPDGSVCVGETSFLGVRGLVEDVECGCGSPFRRCDFWGEVGRAAFGGWSEVDVDRIVAVDRLASRHPTLPFQLAVLGRAELAREIDYYAAWLGSLYSAIADVSGAELIVETSKAPWFASILARVPDLDLRILHLVRDSRAVAYSWTRTTLGPSPVGERNNMARFRPAETAIQWTASNASFHLLARRATAYEQINYERFVTEPDRTLERLSDFADFPLSLPDSRLNEGRVRLGPHHIFSGNPMRSKSGWLTMRVDDEWRSMLPARQRAAVTAMTWPLLRHYGYPTSSRALGRPRQGVAA